jgi:hypothetical protein
MRTSADKAEWPKSHRHKTGCGGAGKVQQERSKGVTLISTNQHTDPKNREFMAISNAIVPE